MLSRCFHFGVFEIFVSSLFLLVLFAFWECCYSALYNSEADSQENYHAHHRWLRSFHCNVRGSATLLQVGLNADFKAKGDQLLNTQHWLLL